MFRACADPLAGPPGLTGLHGLVCRVALLPQEVRRHVGDVSGALFSDWSGVPYDVAHDVGGLPLHAPSPTPPSVKDW